MPGGDIPQPITGLELDVISQSDEKVTRTGHGSIALFVYLLESGSLLPAPGLSFGTGKSLETEPGQRESPQSDAREPRID